MDKKMNLTALNTKRAKLLKDLAKTEAEIRAAGGNTYVIEYYAFQFQKRPSKVTIKNAIDAKDAVKKWRRAYHAYDCQGCSGDYPIHDVYLKGCKTPKGKKTYADRQNVVEMK